jgi:hypothetical protein
MSDSTPYEKLGITEDASFEEVRDARDRLLRALEGDETQQELVEAAYDAILMDRLRARKEGKIAVPDRIRYPERLSTSLPTSFQMHATKGTPSWLQRLLDNPSRRDILLSLGIFSGIGVLNVLLPRAGATTWLTFGLFTSFYLLTRKENRPGRAVLLAFTGVLVGVLLATLASQVPSLGIGGPDFPSPIATILILLVMWLFTCFLR